MNTNIKTARIVGALFIIATVAYSLSVILLDPILGGSDYLSVQRNIDPVCLESQV